MDDVSVINGVTKVKTADDIVYYSKIATLIVNVADDTVQFNYFTNPYNQNKTVPFANLVPNYGTTTAEEYCDFAANNGFFFEPTAAVTIGTIPLPPDASTLSEQEVQTTVLNRIDQSTGNSFGVEFLNQQINTTKAFYGTFAFRKATGSTNRVSILKSFCIMGNTSDDMLVKLYRYDRGTLTSAIFDNATITYAINGLATFTETAQVIKTPNDGEIFTPDPNKLVETFEVYRSTRFLNIFTNTEILNDFEYLFALSTTGNNANIYTGLNFIEK